jgi:heat shock protein HslJ
MTPLARLALPCLASSLALLGSAGLPTAAASSTGPSAEGVKGVVWRLTGYTVKPAQTVPAAAASRLAAGSRIDITFDDQRAAGSSGCNSYTGGYVLDGTTLDIKALAVTRKACAPALMAQEAEYLRILDAVDTAERSGDTLRLSGPAGVLEFVSEGEASLVGAWAMTGYNNGKQAVVSRKSATTVTAVFAEGGRVSGSSGCNTFSGLFEVTGSEVSIGPLVSTQKMCTDADVMLQERLYLKALQAATTFELRGDTLRLRDGDGATQVTFTRQPSTPQ